MNTRTSFRRLVCVIALSAFAVAVMLGAAASARAEATGACSFSGHMYAWHGIKSWYDDIAAGGGVPGALASSETGTYSFDTPAGQTVCAGTSNGAPFASTGTIVSRGNYRNTFCGTGKFWSDDDNSQAYDGLNGNPAPADYTSMSGAGTGTVPHVTSADYVIPLDSGVGTLTVDELVTDVGTGRADGNVEIVPDENWDPRQCITEPARILVISGAFVFQIP